LVVGRKGIGQWLIAGSIAGLDQLHDRNGGGSGCGSEFYQNNPMQSSRVVVPGVRGRDYGNKIPF